MSLEGPEERDVAFRGRRVKEVGARGGGAGGGGEGFGDCLWGWGMKKGGLVVNRSLEQQGRTYTYTYI